MERVEDAEHSSSDSSDEFDSEFTCELCDKSFSGLKPLLQHEKGSRHRKALHRRKVAQELERKDDCSDPSRQKSEPFPIPVPFAECRPCRKEFSGPESFHQHLRGRSHKKTLNGARLLEQVKMGAVTRGGASGGPSPFHAEGVSPDLSDQEEDCNTKVFQCEECGKAFTGVESFFQHLLSKVHQKILKQKGLSESMVADSEDIDLDEGVLICRICQMSFSGPESVEAHLKGRGHHKKIEQMEWKKRRSGEHKTTDGPLPGPSTADDMNHYGTNFHEDVELPKDFVGEDSVSPDGAHGDSSELPEEASKS